MKNKQTTNYALKMIKKYDCQLPIFKVDAILENYFCINVIFFKILKDKLEKKVTWVINN